ncbi:hypothetical protein FRC02_006452 [Tulasnella sp. 418]|nr:hypothetical protein FRC02_006452 [Tulasnella sp. 418]
MSRSIPPRSTALTGCINTKGQYPLSNSVKIHQSRRLNTSDDTKLPGTDDTRVPVRSVVVTATGETHKLNMSQQAEECEAAWQRRTHILKQLLVRDRKAIESLAHDACEEQTASDWIEVLYGETLEDDKDMDVVQEYTMEDALAAYSVIVNTTRGAYYITQRPKFNNYHRDYALHHERQATAWECQYDTLATEYLQWKFGVGLNDEPFIDPDLDTGDPYWEVHAVSWRHELQVLLYHTPLDLNTSCFRLSCFVSYLSKQPSNSKCQLDASRASLIISGHPEDCLFTSHLGTVPPSVIPLPLPRFPTICQGPM